ncbi:hypothetical protein HYQ44_011675 [Verticillium longisporum]|nr:hypothetical protein HYQ44_011675 [Verticillium longisporum]
MATSTSPCKPTSDPLHPTQTPKRSSSDSSVLPESRENMTCPIPKYSLSIVAHNTSVVPCPTDQDERIGVALIDFNCVRSIKSSKKQANRKFGTRDEYPGDIIPINAGNAIPGDISRIVPVLANIGLSGFPPESGHRLDLALRVQLGGARHRFVAIATRNMISAQPW